MKKLLTVIMLLPVVATAQVFTTNVVDKVTNITVTAAYTLTTSLPTFEGLRVVWISENIMRTNTAQSALQFKDFIEAKLEASLVEYNQRRQLEIKEWFKETMQNATPNKQAQALKILLAP